MSWLQQRDKPLFPDLLWSRPENKRHAGKLLIVGGQAGQFTQVSSCFAAAEKAGAGHIRVLLPESLQKSTQHLPNIEYAPSNSSGSFSRKSLSLMNELSEWADGILIAGDLGKNSETTTVLDGYLLRCPLQATVTQDALGSISLPLSQLLKREVIIVCDLPTLQKRSADLGLDQALTSSSTLQQQAEVLAKMSMFQKGSIVMTTPEFIWTSCLGEVTSTKSVTTDLVDAASHCAVWTIQQPDKKLEALTTAIYEVSEQ